MYNFSSMEDLQSPLTAEVESLRDWAGSNIENHVERYMLPSDYFPALRYLHA